MNTTSTALSTGHVGINVIDLERSVHFYTAALGLDVSGEGSDADHRFAFLSSDGALVLTLWQQASDVFAPGRAGLHHLAFEVGSVDEVAAAEARLRDLGAEFVHNGTVAHFEGAESGGIFFHDPDGTRLEIYSSDAGHGHVAPNGEAPTCGFF